MWQDGTFVPCTVHAKKRALPEFEGYTREEEDRLRDFALEELYNNLLHHKRQARYFSEDMQLMADPEYDPPTPPPKSKPKKKRQPFEQTSPRAAAARAFSLRPQGDVGEAPGLPSSPFRQPSRPPSKATSPMHVQSKNMSDFAAFFEQDEDEGWD